MRAALISLAGQPHAPGLDAPVTIGGKSVAERQLEFALAAGCSRLIVVGDGVSREAIALTHAAEAAGLPARTIGGVRGLVGAIGATDALLVLAPALLPDSELALAALEKGTGILVLPATAVASGFERIDLARAWGGALVMPGASLEALVQLADDVAPASALLRVALQAGVPERSIPESSLADGTWSVVGADSAAALEAAWRTRRLPSKEPIPASQTLAALVLRHAPASIIAGRWAALGAPIALAVLLAAGPLLSAYGQAPLGFVAVACAALLEALIDLARRLRASRFAAPPKRSRRIWMIARDAALVACSAGAIDGSWLHKAFPPLVLAVGLFVARSPDRAGAARWLKDRAVVSLGLAIATAAGHGEAAIMAVGLAVLLVGPRGNEAQRG